MAVVNMQLIEKQLMRLFMLLLFIAHDFKITRTYELKGRGAYRVGLILKGVPKKSRFWWTFF